MDSLWPLAQTSWLASGDLLGKKAGHLFGAYVKKGSSNTGPMRSPAKRDFPAKILPSGFNGGRTKRIERANSLPDLGSYQGLKECFAVNNGVEGVW